ncbi:hypothetical protein [Sphingobacterium lumbrici]|uniref:hypothetical protein n=1 Tax=Sphingobacterium lumbrici TaxID=2559600 RepID=UPI001126BEC2|nr:hypothetical protein [Sphingobacterium lumbrici]
MNIQNATLSFHFNALSINMVIPLINGDTVVMDVFRPEDLEIRPTSPSTFMDINDFKKDVTSILERVFREHGRVSLQYLNVSYVEDAAIDIINKHLNKHNRLVIDDLYFFVDQIVFIVATADQQLKQPKDPDWYTIMWEETMSELLHEFQDYVMVLDPLTQDLKKYKS